MCLLCEYVVVGAKPACLRLNQLHTWEKPCKTLYVENNSLLESTLKTNKLDPSKFCYIPLQRKTYRSSPAITIVGAASLFPCNPFAFVACCKITVWILSYRTRARARFPLPAAGIFLIKSVWAGTTAVCV